MAAHSVASVPVDTPASSNPTGNLIPPAVSANGTNDPSGLTAFSSPTKASSAPSSLGFRIIAGPLSLADRTRILSEYNRLTGSRVPVQQFRRWTEQSPSGPALHALLETEDGHIAGHCALVPFALQGPGGAVAVAKEHYFFLSEEYRSRPVHGFADSKQSAAALLLGQLHAQASKQGWKSILACVPPQLEPIHDPLGYRPVDFTVRDCFFILHPVRAWRTMHHLPLAKQASLFATSAANWTYASCVSPLQHIHGLVRRSRIADHSDFFSSRMPQRISLSGERDFLGWRYPESSYSPMVVRNGSDGYVIAAKGTPFVFARVCQFQVPSLRTIPAIVEKLVRDARASHAVGVRWSVYGNGEEQDRLVAELRKRTFLCIPRHRRILVSSPDSELISQANWNLCDSLFTFDA